VAFASNVGQVQNATVETANVTYLTAPAAAVTPASGAPGAFKQLLANATPTTPWWFCALIVGNLSAAGATRFDYGVNRAQDGTGSNIFTEAIIMEAALTLFDSHFAARFPVKVIAGVGAGVQQLTASTKTLDCAMQYAQNVGS